MKKSRIILIAAMLIALAFVVPNSASASRVIKTCKAMNAAGTVVTVDSPVTNTDTSYLILANSGDNSGIQAFNEFEDVIYSWTALPSISGTTTSGTIVLAQGSNTGTFAAYGSGDWVNLVSDNTQSTVIAPGQTSAVLPVHISGSTAIYGNIILAKNQFRYVRLVYVTAGTQTSMITATCSILPHG